MDQPGAQIDSRGQLILSSAWEAVVYPSANGESGATAGRVGLHGALSSPIEHDSEHKTSGSVFRRWFDARREPGVPQRFES
jgi:hypothetical protein